MTPGVPLCWVPKGCHNHWGLKPHPGSWSEPGLWTMGRSLHFHDAATRGLALGLKFHLIASVQTTWTLAKAKVRTPTICH